jgi:hypothetical protein
MRSALVWLTEQERLSDEADANDEEYDTSGIIAPGIVHVVAERYSPHSDEVHVHSVFADVRSWNVGPMAPRSSLTDHWLSLYGRRINASLRRVPMMAFPRHTRYIIRCLRLMNSGTIDFISAPRSPPARNRHYGDAQQLASRRDPLGTTRHCIPNEAKPSAVPPPPSGRFGGASSADAANPRDRFYTTGFGNASADPLVDRGMPSLARTGARGNGNARSPSPQVASLVFGPRPSRN